MMSTAAQPFPRKSSSGSPAGPTGEAKTRGGRPTKAAAAERDERLLDIATQMFLDQGFDATSMERLAEAAAIGKATLYARYSDKGELFAAVLRRRIPQVYAPIEEEFNHAALANTDLETMLRRIGYRLVDKATSSESVAMARILAAQAPRFPELASLALKEGADRQLNLVERILGHYAQQHAFASDDFPMLADLFVALIIGRTARLALFGMLVDGAPRKRVDAAVAFFLRGLLSADPAVG